ncbi:MAG TPA: tetratricopeptide repeat protein [Rhodocyclaceae bacterium]|nr:tetratricopeptide repeat protein [Rhodocyclaceae bacterium]
MAHYDLEEQEQIDSIKTWWKMYGNLITGVVTAAALGVVGWQGWGWYQRSQSAQASAIYSVLEQAVAGRDGQRVKAAAGELAEKFGGTTYAPLGALMAAKFSFESGDLKTAQAQLTWAAGNGKNELKDVARLRLAAILLDEKAYDEALKQLDSAHAAAFDARFAELKGDVLAAQGKKDEAKAAYQAAIAKLDSKNGQAEVADRAATPYRQLIEQKLDSLGAAA